MANRLLDRLREKDKKGLFTSTQTSISYTTGFAPFDYRNGYIIEVKDLQENLITSYNSLGIVGGTFITIIGKSGTAKTTFAVQVASKIVKPFENALVMHYDMEQATSYTRVANITGLTRKEMDDKYVLKQEKNYIEDIFDVIIAIAKEKEECRKDYMYDTGLKDEFNRPIGAFVPTVILLDSIPTMASKDASDAMEGGTYANRAAKALAQFYKRLMPVIKAYNITVIAINHLNTKIEINPMMKTQPQLLYMKMDESIPGGNAPIYYAQNLIKFVTAGKYIADEDGFDGFNIRCEFLKSRTNKAGQYCNLVYNQVLGFDPVMTQYEFANNYEVIGGRNPYRYVIDHQDIKFDSRKFRKEFLTNEKLRFALMDKTVPILEKQLSSPDPNDGKLMDIVELLNRLEASQEHEDFSATA